MTQPEKLWCWNFQTEKGGWGKGWGGYARPDPRHPLDDRERNTGAEYVRVDVAEAAMKEAREKALREAADMVRSNAYTTNGGERSLEPVAEAFVGMDMHHATVADAILALIEKPDAS